MISTVVWLDAYVEEPSDIFYKTKFEEETFKTVKFSSSVGRCLTLPASLPTIKNTAKV